MTTIQDIDRELNEQVKREHSRIYDGFVPEKFIEYFKKAIMFHAPALHNIKMSKVEQIAKHKIDEIPTIDIGIVINTIFSTPFDKIYSSFEEGVEMTKEFEIIRNEYNKRSAEFEASIMKQRALKKKICGLDKDTTEFKLAI